MVWIIFLLHNYPIVTKKNYVEPDCLIFCNIYQNNMKMVSFQLPAKYPQLPALLVGQIDTLIWCIPWSKAYPTPQREGHPLIPQSDPDLKGKDGDPTRLSGSAQQEERPEEDARDS